MSQLRIGDDRLQMAVEEQGESERRQENTECHCQSAQRSTAEVADESRKDDQGCWQNAGESDAIEEVAFGHPLSAFHGIVAKKRRGRVRPTDRQESGAQSGTKHMGRVRLPGLTSNCRSCFLAWWEKRLPAGDYR